MNRVHTPGPWEVIRWTSHAKTTVVTCEPMDDGKRNVIADCWGGNRLLVDCEPDARLIAAAPELLDALHYALAILNACGGNTAAERKGAMSKGRAAIAKATGDQA